MNKYEGAIIASITRNLSRDREKLRKAFHILDNMGAANPLVYTAIDGAYVSIIENGLKPANSID